MLGAALSCGVRFSVSLSCGLLLSLWLHAAAHAQGYESALLDGVAARDRALETGNHGDWQRALQHFARARQASSTKEVEFEYAEAALRVELWVEAYAAYETALALGIQGKAEARARAFLSARAREVARLDIQGPSGASVYVDDVKRAELPLPRPLVVRAGALALRLERSNFRSWQRQLDVGAASLTRLELELEPVARSSVPVAELPGSVEPGPSERASSGSLQPAPVEVSPWAGPALIAGGSLFLVGAVGLVTTSLLLPDARRELAGLCSESDTDGRCLFATAANRGSAQSAADRIETLENMRWVTASGAALGMVAATVGFVQRMRGRPSTLAEQATRMAGRPTVGLRASEQGLALEWQGKF